MSDAPERITATFENDVGDTKYIRADLYEALTAERDEYKRNAAYSEDVVRAARAEIDRLREALIGAKAYLENGMEILAFNVLCTTLKGQQP